MDEQMAMKHAKQVLMEYVGDEDCDVALARAIRLHPLRLVVVEEVGKWIEGRGHIGHVTAAYDALLAAEKEVGA
jgi:hypothetical protein